MSEFEASLDEMAASPAVGKALAFIEDDHKRVVDELVELVKIAAPTFHEQERAAVFAGKLKLLGLEDVRIDAANNVYGVRRGSGSGPTIVVDAHLDTVFGIEIPLDVRVEGDRIYCPGIGDDTAGLAAMLGVIRALDEVSIETRADIIFLGTSCHEGEGDLKGIKRFVDDHPDVSAIIHLEPIGEDVVYLATGSHRYEVVYSGPGGHSWIEYGLPSAIHALGRGIAKISDLKLPVEPKTTLNAGVVSGGFSVNTIAAEARMRLDLRSADPDELAKLDATVRGLLQEAASEETAHATKPGTITVAFNQIGDRPAGRQSPDAQIVKAALWAGQKAGRRPALAGPMSTNGNYPISKGIPVVVVSNVSDGGEVHSVNEWVVVKPAEVKALFLLVMALAG